MKKVYFLFCLLYLFSLVILYVSCVDNNKNAKKSKRKSQAETMEKTEGDQKFHEIKLGRDLDLHSRSREAFAKQIVENNKKPNHFFYSEHGIEPVVKHLEKKIKKHHQNVKDLTLLRKLPGPQTVTDLANKVKLPHTYDN